MRLVRGFGFEWVIKSSAIIFDVTKMKFLTSKLEFFIKCYDFSKFDTFQPKPNDKPSKTTIRKTCKLVLSVTFDDKTIPRHTIKYKIMERLANIKNPRRNITSIP